MDFVKSGNVIAGVNSFGLTDQGKVRTSNQDHFMVATLRKAFQVEHTSLPNAHAPRSRDNSHLFVLADGVGGHAGGERASALAISSVDAFTVQTLQWFTRLAANAEDKLLADFQKALQRANARVLAEGQVHPELRGLGTTLTLAFSLNDTLFVAHVGDSRCYLHREGELTQITRDHTLVGDMVREGTLGADAAAEHHLRHIITNYVGGDSADLQVEVHAIDMEPGDLVLLCSDGLTGMVSDEGIAAVLQAEGDPEQACRRLVAQANENGGHDNVTVIVARFDGALNAQSD